MAILADGWYKGSVPFYEITEINISNTGNGDESWDGSASQDGSIMCYRNGTRVNIVSNTITEIGENAFFKFLALKKVTGLSSATVIGALAFCYTPNLDYVDIVPEVLTSIGESAFRMSSVEDTLDLSTVSLDIVGDKATRHKRWSTSSLVAIENIEFSKTIYLNVPNSENQKNYPNVLFGVYNGEEISVADAGCSALTFYHIWNYIHAGTDKQYDTWLDWYNDTINDSGDFAVNNPMTVQVEEQIAVKLGWTYSGRTRVSNEAQLQTIIDRLAVGYPTFATVHSINNIGGLHNIAFVGCNYKTHKLAIIDPNVVGTSGTISWLSFEDIFVEGDDDQDRLTIMDFNLPILAPNSSWFTQGGTSVNKSNITEIEIKDTYTPTGVPISSWDASSNKDGSVMAYVEGTKLILAGNGHGKIALNPDGSNAFNGFGKLERIIGGNYLDTSRATTLERMCQMCFALEAVDVGVWNTSNVTSIKAMFQGDYSIKKLDVSKWETANIVDMSVFLNMSQNYHNTSLTILDVSKWDTNKVTTMNGMFYNCIGLTTLDVSNWKTCNVTNMASMFGCYNSDGQLQILDVSGWDVSRVTALNTLFQNQALLTTLDVSNWKTGACTTMNHMFHGCTGLTELDLSGWDATKCTTMTSMFYNTLRLNKVILGEKFSFNGNGTLSSNNIAVLPTPDGTYITGADGNWYDVDGNTYTAANIPSGKFGVYYASPVVKEKDFDEMVLVKKGNLMRTAQAIRSRAGTNVGYAPAEFADAVQAIV